jgi:uncharacterized membrane protein YraQ (UPF0718 family)
MSVNYEQLLLIFASILYEALPFIVLGVVIAGVLEEFVPQQLLARLFHTGVLAGRSARLLAIALGGVLGLVFPMCECGIVPIMQRLLRKGVPVGVCISYMLAGPIINVVVISATYVAFNPPDAQDYLFPLPGEDGLSWLSGPRAVTALRLGLGFVVAWVTGLLVEVLYQRWGNRLFTASLVEGLAANEEAPAALRPRPWLARLGHIAETALHDFVDIMTFLVLGAALAAVVRTSLQGSQISALVETTPPIAILGLMGLAVAICLCSEADAFVAAAFPAAWPPAAKIAFLVLGPMLDFKLLLMYTRVFRPRLIWIIVLAVACQVFLYTLALHYLWNHHGYPQRLWPQLSAGGAGLGP